MSPITGALASPHALATRAGEQAFRAGGNAIDAALAAATALTVVYPHNTALGGDLVALVRTPDGSITCVNATGTAPAARDRTALSARHGDRLPERGPDTVTVPGAVRGWAALRGHGAALGWAAQFEAAIAYAAEGVPVARSLAAAFVTDRALLEADAGSRVVFAPRGEFLREGDLLVQPNLARSLGALAAGGPDEFYTGATGTALARGLQDLGCPLTTGDLAGYTVRETAAISAPLGGFRVHTSPPNTQGFALLRTVRALTELGFAAAPWTVPASVLGRLFHDGTRVRDTLLADPAFADEDVDNNGFAELLAQLRDPGPRAAIAVAAPSVPRGDTVGVAAADSAGYAVSIIQSVFDSFGAGLLEPETGVIVQNRGTSFSLDPRSPNVIEPGKRPRHTLMPVLVTHADGRVRWVNSTMGGHGQPQIHAQVLLRLLAGDSPAAAVSAPRWLVGARAAGQDSDTVHHEADLAAATVVDLAADGFPLREVPARTEFLGHTNVVALAADGTFTAGSDPRSDGSAAVVPA
ncbi:gamma-glutamyltransferase family protein [Amycolatopsis sp. NPDC004368]